MRRRIIFIGIGVLLVIGLAAFLPFVYAPETTDGAPSAEVGSGEHYRYWLSQVENGGPLRAYRDFKSAYADVSVGTAHLAAHVMGDVLYAALGSEGITVCDPTFGFGCFHGFFVSALSSEGESIVSELDDACVERFGELGTGCQHGIGHGILEYVGHDNIRDALALCGETTQVVPVLGCTSGVFMEYNSPMLIEEAGALFEPLPVDPQQPYGVCRDVRAQYRDSCYLELGGWWHAAQTPSYAEMDTWCGAIANRDHRTFCYLGVGNVVAPSHNYNEDASRTICSRFKEVEARALCFSGVAWAFYANPERRAQSEQICQELEPVEGRTLCERYRRLDRLSSN